MANSTDIEVAREQVSQRYGLARTVVWASVAAFGLYCLRDMVGSLAGKDTFVGLWFSFFGDVKFVVSIGGGAFGVLFGLRERRLRHKKVGYLTERVRELEQAIDPHRSTSGLTPEGKTNPRDK